MLILIQYLPFWGIMLLANRAERDKTARTLTYLSLVLVNLFLLCGALVCLGLYAISQPEWREAMPDLVLPFESAALLGLAGALAATALAALAFLLPPVRRLLARWLPIDPASCMDCVALAFAVYFVGLTALQFGLLGGVEGLALADFSPTAADLLFSGLALIIFALLGVGWIMRRSTGETLRRLGLGRMQAKHLLLALGLIPAFLILDVAVSLVWSSLDPAGAEQVANANKALFGGMATLSLAVPLALATGIGEEVLFRGAVQPRLGLWFTSVTFALGHLQYGLSPALLQILALGLVLGLVRQRVNTTTCIVIHALYNLSNLFLMSWLSQFAS